MAERVVDALEAVDIEKAHRDMLVVSFGQGEGLAKPIVQQEPVGQPGEGSCWAWYDISRDSRRAAPTSRKTITAPTTVPWASRIGAAESSMAISRPSRRTNTQFGVSPTAVSSCTASASGSRAGRPVMASASGSTSRSCRPSASWRDQPVMRSAAAFR